jgi:mycothiol synthase
MLEDLKIRPPTINDKEAINGIMRIYDLAQYGEEDFTLEDLRTIWSAPGINLTDDMFLVFDQAEQLIGCLFLEQHKYAKFFVTIRILPGHNNSVINDYLLSIAEVWARKRMSRAEPGMRITLNGWLPSTDGGSRQCYERANFQEVRRRWRMEIELTESPATPKWPEDIELRTYVPGRDDYSVFETIDKAFLDYWGHIPHEFDAWKHWTIDRPEFDPSLWFIAYEGDQPVGCSICVDGAVGWIDTLAVLRPWRRKGLGLALLLHSLGQFYRRDHHRVGLGVDSQSLTNATRLYQQVGMHIVRESIFYEKELLAGVELSVRSLQF